MHRRRKTLCIITQQKPRKMNRSIAPKIDQVFQINVPKAEITTLNDGTKVHLLNMGTEDTLRISFVFEAGAWNQSKPLIANFTQQMLNKGTATKSAYQISEQFDFYGAYNAFGTGMHHSTAHFYLLTKYIDEVLPQIGELIHNPSFPENELKILVDNQRQNFIINQNKVAYVAAREFDKAMFGAEHPYGNKADLNDFDKVEINDIKKFFSEVTSQNNLQIVIAGKIPDNLIEKLNQHISQEIKQKNASPSIDKTALKSTNLKHFKEVDNAVQSSIKAGFETINRTHPDFFSLKILNTIFGGFFGSRLMSNIREDKGYTYGIHSSIVSYRNKSMLLVSTETGNEFRDAVCKEIDFEMRRLMTELVSTNELEKVRNYMFNDLLRSIEQSFSYGDVYQSLLEFNISPDYLIQSVETLKTITPERVMHLANTYFKPEEVLYCIAGGKI